MTKVVINLASCTGCPNHQIIPDPDPTDSFNYDDVAVVCRLVPNPNLNANSRYATDWQEYRCITVVCRPYNVKKETEVPEWCPMREGTK